MWAWVLVVALAAGARADCDACVAGRCHSRRTLLKDFHVYNQLAIDRTDNILYAQLEPDTITALFLDEHKLRSFKVANTTKGLAVDQKTQTVYTSNDGVIYQHKYRDDGYSTDMAFRVNKLTTPARLRYEDTLYIVNTDGSSAYYSKNAGRFAGYDNLEQFQVTDFVNVANITHWFFVSDYTLYKFIWDNDSETSNLISHKKQALSIGKHGDVYVGEVHKRVLYKLDRQKKSFVQYATYNGSPVVEFVFDKENNIVFRDAYGNVAQWVPDPIGICYQSSKHMTE